MPFNPKIHTLKTIFKKSNYFADYKHPGNPHQMANTCPSNLHRERTCGAGWHATRCTFLQPSVQISHHTAISLFQVHDLHTQSHYQHHMGIVFFFKLPIKITAYNLVVKMGKITDIFLNYSILPQHILPLYSKKKTRIPFKGMIKPKDLW